MRILSVVGNRPQFIKAAAVSHRLRARATEVLCHTGQHHDRELSELFFSELGLPEPEHRLPAGSGTHAQMTGRIMLGLEPLVADERPDAVLVYGDTNTTLAGALVAAKACVPLAHVEAGMRSFDRRMPEEVNRVVTDRLSQVALCATATAVENLSREGLGHTAELVGDVQADIALLLGPAAERRSDALERLGLQPRGYGLVTAHRAGNVDSPERLAALVELLVACAGRMPLVLPAHPRTRTRLRAAELEARLESAGVRVTEPVGYADTAALLRGAAVCLTDSGGLQKEAYLAGVPCVTLRDTTEWVETVDASWNRLVDLDAGAACRAIDELGPRRDEPAPDPEIYGGGQAGQRAVAALLARLGSSGA